MDEALHSSPGSRRSWPPTCGTTSGWDVLTRRHLDVVRTAGALSLLPLALTNRAVFAMHSGDLAAAASLLAERAWVAEVTGGEPRLTPYPRRGWPRSAVRTRWPSR